MLTDIACMHVVATYVKFTCDLELNGQKHCKCGRQLHAKSAWVGGHNTAKPPVFCNNAERSIV